MPFSETVDTSRAYFTVGERTVALKIIISSNFISNKRQQYKDKKT